MRYIKKGKEPRSLKQYRSTPNATYNGYHETDDLRYALVKEQGYICCYCMQRINNNSKEMKIEHWKPQKYSAFQLNYKNLLGACKGNEGSSKHLEHCDTSKKEKEITINPLNKNCESLILYGTDGSLSSKNEDVNNDFKVLNLNLESFRKIRIAVLDSLVKGMIKEFPSGGWTKSYIEKQILKWSLPKNGEYIPYCQVVIFYLRKKLKQAQ